MKRQRRRYFYRIKRDEVGHYHLTRRVSGIKGHWCFKCVVRLPNGFFKGRRRPKPGQSVPILARQLKRFKSLRPFGGFAL